MQENGNGIAPIIARIKYEFGAFDVYGFREKAGYEAAKERCKEEIELLKFLLPTNNGGIKKDLIFLALHRGYKQQKAARALSRETIALMKEAAAQKRGKAYEEKIWRELCNAKELREWPLRSYGDSLNTLVVNMARAADYIKSLEAEMAAYPQITETNFGQKINNMLSKGGDWLEDITKGIGAIITEWRSVKKEEDKKSEQRAGQPAGNGFTPTPFDLHSYTNSDVANQKGITNITSDAKVISNLQLIHKAVQEIERFLGRKIDISSGFRTKELNDVLEGSSNSSNHMKGYVADIYLNESEQKKVMIYLKDNMTNENRKNKGLPILNQAISYSGRGFFHIDVNPNGEAKNNDDTRFRRKEKGKAMTSYFK